MAAVASSYPLIIPKSSNEMSRDPATEKVVELNRQEIVRQGPIQPADQTFPTSTSRNLRFQALWFARDDCGKFLE